MEHAVTYVVDERNVAIVTLNRADKHNAFDDEMIAELTRVFKQAGEDSQVRAVILQAKGKSFSAGANLNWMKKLLSGFRIIFFRQMSCDRLPIHKWWKYSMLWEF